MLSKKVAFEGVYGLRQPRAGVSSPECSADNACSRWCVADARDSFVRRAKLPQRKAKMRDSARARIWKVGLVDVKKKAKPGRFHPPEAHALKRGPRSLALISIHFMAAASKKARCATDCSHHHQNQAALSYPFRFQPFSLKSWASLRPLAGSKETKEERR